MIAFVQDPDVTFFAQVNFMKTEVIYLRLNPRIKEAVNVKALDEGKSVNLWLQDLICKELGLEVEQKLKLVRNAAGQVA